MFLVPPHTADGRGQKAARFEDRDGATAAAGYVLAQAATGGLCAVGPVSCATYVVLRKQLQAAALAVVVMSHQPFLPWAVARPGMPRKAAHRSIVQHHAETMLTKSVCCRATRGPG